MRLLKNKAAYNRWVKRVDPFYYEDCDGPEEYPCLGESFGFDGGVVFHYLSEIEGMLKMLKETK